MEQNKVEKSQQELFLEFIQTEIGRKISNYLYSLMKLANKCQGVVVFLSRKGYWLYRVFRKYNPWGEDLFQGVTIVSDRYVVKWVNESWHKKNIFIVDDTLTTGTAMFTIYQKMKQQYPEADVVTVAMFSLMTKSELKEKYEKRVEEKEQDAGELMEDYQKFLDSLMFGEISLPADLGWLSYNQIALFQKLLTPYVVDLPLLQNKKGTTISSEKFQRLKGIKSGWQYEDNSYKLYDIEIAEENVESVYCGFFQCTNPFLLQSMGKYVFQMVVKCRYENLQDGSTELIFTPFAVLKSMEWLDALKICLELYKGTSFGEYLLRKLDGGGKEEEKYGILIYRSIVYFLSIYGGELFREALKSDYQINDIIFNVELLQENSEKVFIETIEEIIKTWTEKDYRDRIYASGMVSPVGEPIEYTDERKLTEEMARTVYFKMYQEVIERKRADGSDGFVSLEDLFISAESVMPELPKTARLKLFMKALLQMLDQSVLGNRLICEHRYISRGFRFGENSDVAIPFYNEYIYGGVLELYTRCRRIYANDSWKEKFFEGIRLLLRGIETRARNNGYLNLFFSEWELQCNQWYFSNRGGKEDFHSLVENKSFRLNYGQRSRTIEEDILSCVDEIVRC